MSPLKLKLFCDGGSRGNPGIAGIGVAGFVEGPDGKKQCVLERSEFLTDRSNNYAEYVALITALDLAYKSGYDPIEVYSDSKLIVEQINGNWKIKNVDLKNLYSRAMEKVKLIRADGVKLTLSHVRREFNSHADSLANLAMDRQVEPEAPKATVLRAGVERWTNAMVNMEKAVKTLKAEPRMLHVEAVEKAFAELTDAWVGMKL